MRAIGPYRRVRTVASRVAAPVPSSVADDRGPAGAVYTIAAAGGSLADQALAPLEDLAGPSRMDHREPALEDNMLETFADATRICPNLDVTSGWSVQSGLAAGSHTLASLPHPSTF